jgi:hypothetical protein
LPESRCRNEAKGTFVADSERDSGTPSFLAHAGMLFRSPLAIVVTLLRSFAAIPTAPLLNLRTFAALADVAKGGDGAKSALRLCVRLGRGREIHANLSR